MMEMISDSWRRAHSIATPTVPKAKIARVTIHPIKHSRSIRYSEYGPSGGLTCNASLVPAYCRFLALVDVDSIAPLRVACLGIVLFLSFVTGIHESVHALRKTRDFITFRRFA